MDSSAYIISTEVINLIMDIDDAELDVDTMMPLGLIINELLTNSLKYTFDDNKIGVIKVNLKKKGNINNLELSNNGNGYDPTEVRENAFGAPFIIALTEQLEGNLTHDMTYGTTVNIEFKVAN